MRQKFIQGTFVHITKEMPKSMSHFDSDVDAIVKGTYAQLCGPGSESDFQDYHLYLIDSDGKIDNSCAWYDEDQLTALSEQDPKKAAQMVEDYLIEMGCGEEDEDE